MVLLLMALLPVLAEVEYQEEAEEEEQVIMRERMVAQD
jgi:hypothetical protein